MMRDTQLDRDQTRGHFAYILVNQMAMLKIHTNAQLIIVIIIVIQYWVHMQIF